MASHLLELDHLVVAARTLGEGAAYVSDTLGAEPAGGGAHPLMRTHNRLFGLWGGAYLEVIAIDPNASTTGDAPRPRLFALDAAATHERLARGPYLAHWVARVNRPRQLALWQRQYPSRIPPVVRMTRGDFGWGLTVPDDGSLPAWHGAGDGLVPSLIQWDDRRHPSDTLPQGGIALKALKGAHPHAEAVREQLDWLGAAHLIAIDDAPGELALAAEFETPNGLRTLR